MNKIKTWYNEKQKKTATRLLREQTTVRLLQFREEERQILSEIKVHDRRKLLLLDNPQARAQWVKKKLQLDKRLLVVQRNLDQARAVLYQTEQIQSIESNAKITQLYSTVVQQTSAILSPSNIQRDITLSTQTTHQLNGLNNLMVDQPGSIFAPDATSLEQEEEMKQYYEKEFAQQETSHVDRLLHCHPMPTMSVQVSPELKEKEDLLLQERKYNEKLQEQLLTLMQQRK